MTDDLSPLDDPRPEDDRPAPGAVHPRGLDKGQSDATVSMQVQRSLGELVGHFELLCTEMGQEALRRATVCHEWERRVRRIVECFCRAVESSHALGEIPPDVGEPLGGVVARVGEFWTASRRAFRCLGDAAAVPSPDEREHRFLSLLTRTHLSDTDVIRANVGGALDAVHSAAETELDIFRNALTAVDEVVELKRR